MLKVALCEDGLNDLAFAEKIISEITSLKIDFDVFTNGKDLLNTINTDGKYDVYLLDIQLPGISGLDIAKEIRKNDLYSLLIFITSYSKYVFEAYDYIAFGYLRKPLSKNKLESILLKSENYLQKNKYLFQYNFKKVSYSIACRDIYYFCKSSRKAYIHTAFGIRECNMRINDILGHLESNYFVQISRSCIVNMQYVEVVQKNCLYITGKKFSIGETHLKDFFSRYSDYIESLR